MTPFLQQTAISLKLHYRNRMALLYGYLFPLVFLLAFYVLYRHESVVLIRHMGELLTVGILGGACFGLPTTLVSERERGVWRRYRLAPVPTGGLVASTVVARYAILISAGVLQVAAALALGMPLPRHPGQLLLAFTCVSFAFIGLGLVMAALADNVPAVQALGQCIFLPMLIIGGVAVPLAALPDWAQHLAAFFPGRYAVQAIQASVNGAEVSAAGFDLLALLTIGAAGCVAGGVLFRWDAQQRFSARRGTAWIALPLAAWAAVGIAAEATGRVKPPAGGRSSASRGANGPASGAPAAAPLAETPTAPPPAPETPAGTAPGETPSAPAPAEAAKPGVDPAPPAAAGKIPGATAAPGPTPELPANAGGAPGTATPAPATAPPAPSAAPSAPAPAPPLVAQPIAPTWREVTRADIDRDLIFDRLPSDSGVVAPIAPADEQPAPEVAEVLEGIRFTLPTWGPAKVPDTVQRVRNILYVAAVPDVHQTELERFAPYVVYDELQRTIPKEDLMKALYWIALHPMDGDDSAIDRLPELGFENRAVDPEQARERVALYAVKLLGRLTGAIHAG